MLWSVFSFGQTEIRSRLDKVTVYPSMALIEKSVKVSLQKGKNTFLITGNATHVDPDDIHFAYSDKWFASSINTKTQTLPKKEAAKKTLPQNVYQQYIVLNDKLENINSQINDIENDIKVLNSQKNALENLKAIRNTSQIDTIVTIKEQFNFQREETKNIIKLITEAYQKQKELNYQKDNILGEIETLIKKYVGGKQILDNQSTILLSIYSNENLPNETLRYAYRVGGVSSFYSYDIMFDEEKKSAVFCLKNSVEQFTGENWRNCEIVFSTSDGGYAGYDAELYPYYLDFNTIKTNYKAGVSQNTTLLSTAREESAVFEVVDNAPFVAGSSHAQNLTLNKEYTLNTPLSIATNEDAQTIPLYSANTKVDFSRFTTPKNEEKVFYTALLPDWEDLSLLKTDCDIYLNNKFVSESYINTDGMGDTMRFSLGEDKNVKITRKLRKNAPSQKGLLSKEIAETATITITIKNTKSEEVSLSVKDQIPISANSEIKITDVDLAGGSLEESTGVIRWNVTLAPKQEKKVIFSYTVRYPKGNRITLN